MAKTLWLTAWLNGSPDLPPLRDPDGGLQLAFTNATGDHGGFCVLCSRRDKVALVLVFSSKATALAMKALPAKYLFLGVGRVAEGEADPGITMPTRAAVVTFLQGHGVATGSLPSTAETIKRWLRNAAGATDAAIDGAEMT